MAIVDPSGWCKIYPKASVWLSIRTFSVGQMAAVTKFAATLFVGQRISFPLTQRVVFQLYRYQSLCNWKCEPATGAVIQSQRRTNLRGNKIKPVEHDLDYGSLLQQRI